jgi:RNA polymerase sigma-32 factor
MSTALTRRHDSELDRYISEVSQYPLLSREKENELARRWRDRQDVKAAHELVVSNLRFVVKIAYQYRGYGLRLLDVVQEGNIGLMKAVKKFDPDKGYRLISYAVWWIRAQIHEYIMRSWSLVKLGSGRLKRKLFFKLRSERSRMEQEVGLSEKDASTSELAERLGVSENLVGEMELRMAARDFSLDAPLAESSEASHLDMVRDIEPDQEAQVAYREEQRILEGVLHQAKDDLDDKERFILENRLLAQEPETLAEIGKRYGVSRERARQIESKLLDKLKSAAIDMGALPAPSSA